MHFKAFTIYRYIFSSSAHGFKADKDCIIIVMLFSPVVIIFIK